MRLLTPLIPDPAAPLARANPVAKLAAALVLMVALFVSVDIVTGAIALAGLLAVLPFTGLRVGVLLARTWPILLAAVSVGIFNVLFAASQEGTELLRIGPVSVGAVTLLNGAGLALRLGAIALAGVLAAASTQPTDLADSLVQQLRVPARFAVGALAAFRLLPLLAQEWQILGMARRARGVEAGRSPLAAIRLFAGQMLSLLVGAIRRGTRMALAMEARGFGAMACRSVARPQRMRPGDWAWIGVAAALGALAVGISLGLGTWRFLLG